MNRSSVSVLAKININCTNMVYWYQLAKNSTQYGSSLYSSASSLAELGSIICNINQFTIFNNFINQI